MQLFHEQWVESSLLSTTDGQEAVKLHLKEYQPQQVQLL